MSGGESDLKKKRITQDKSIESNSTGHEGQCCLGQGAQERPLS